MKYPDMENYPIVPGRSLVTLATTKMRQEYLAQLGYNIEKVALNNFSYSDIQNKIESFIGSIEIPIGLIGPLLFCEKDQDELVYGGAATLEGALVASMNRGAKAVSMSGGFTATFKHQKMVRVPMFIFSSSEEATLFQSWIQQNFVKIKSQAEKHSNHATLLNIDSPNTCNNIVHTRFYYTTGDASGQNMTTTCTWHAMLWIVKQFTDDTQIPIQHYVIEGNGASDKKVSTHSVKNGRGVHVVAECFLKENIIEKILRTTSDNIIRCFAPSVELSKTDGMFGYNINVSNAIAAIYAATGQDLGSIHESAVGILNIEKIEGGLYLKLILPTLVLGTVGGGTFLPKQNEVLKLMNCEGKGNIERFAKLIAGFALSLEISTYAAIVSGEFAKAHEKLGRNKPVDWLTLSELNEQLINQIIKTRHPTFPNFKISFKDAKFENGIITNLTGRISRKLIGFFPLIANNESLNLSLIVKSKALDKDVIKGLHNMAASIDPALSDLIQKYRNQSEYHKCHLKEILLYENLSDAKFSYIPKYFGNYTNPNREIFLLIIECLINENMLLLNSENMPEKWSSNSILNVIDTISEIHYYLMSSELINNNSIQEFSPSDSQELYQKLIDIIIKEEDNQDKKMLFSQLYNYLNDIKEKEKIMNLPQTIVHNDFNPRNIGIRSNGEPCFYDWELAVKNIPHRDIVEFLAFVLTDVSEKILPVFLERHAAHWQTDLSDKDWMNGYIYATKEFLVCRMSFYKAAEILMNLKFPDRVINNCFLMLQFFENIKSTNSKPK